jgi:S-(hydroxymethyl)mycothiol dehydrogenase
LDRGVVLSEVGRFGLEQIEVEPPGPDEVLVRLEASGICHTDLHVAENGWAHPLPVLLGHEGVGIVEVTGAGVSHVAVGDRITLGWRSPCGECRWCLRGDPRRCRTPPAAEPRLRFEGKPLSQTLRLGTFATRTVVHSSAAVPLRVDVPPEQACLIACCVVTGVGSVLHTAQVWEGARVGVIGCGAVGLSVVQGARIAGAAEIYAIDLNERKVELARGFGATHSGPGKRLDFVFDVVGRPETVAQGLELLGHAGTLVYVGLPQPCSSASLPLEPFFDKRTRILVSHGGDHLPAEDFPQLVAWAAEGKLDLAGMVSETIGLDEAAGALANLDRSDAVRTVIVF